MGRIDLQLIDAKDVVKPSARLHAGTMWRRVSHSPPRAKARPQAASGCPDGACRRGPRLQLRAIAYAKHRAVPASQRFQERKIESLLRLIHAMGFLVAQAGYTDAGGHPPSSRSTARPRHVPALARSQQARRQGGKYPAARRRRPRSRGNRSPASKKFFPSKSLVMPIAVRDIIHPWMRTRSTNHAATHSCFA